MAQLTVDTPDYQRGVVSAQVLLAAVPGNTIEAEVGVPPNAETLVVVLKQAGAIQQCVCTGLQTGVRYGGAAAGGAVNSVGDVTWFFDVSQAVDSTVQLRWVSNPVQPWWVYADAGAHLTLNLADNYDAIGAQLVTVVPPTVNTGGATVPVIQVASVGLNATGTVVGAPGAGTRVRVFEVSMGPASTNIAGYLAGSVSGTPFARCGGLSNMTQGYAGVGYILDADEGITYHPDIGGGYMYCTVVYLVEAL